MKYLNFINFYGENIQLYFNESANYKTFSGAILSLLVIIFAAFITAYNLIQFFTKRSVNLIFQTQFSKDFKPINLTNERYSTAFNFLNITDKVQGFNNYNLTVFDNYNRIMTPISIKDQNFSLGICSSNMIDKMIDFVDNTDGNNVLKYLKLTTKTYCPFLSDNKIYELGGDFLYSGVNSYISTNFTVSLTNVTINENNLESLKNSILLNMLFIDTYPNISSSEGFSKFINYYGIYVDFTKDYAITINYQNNRLTTDE